MADRTRKALILARGGRRLSRAQRQLLERIEQELPERTHLRIWTEIEIFDLDGTVRELDAVALGHYGLYALSLKDVPGRLEGDDRTWTVEAAGAQSSVMDNPVLVVGASADRLERFFEQELGIGLPGTSVEPLVLLSNDNVEISLPSSVRQHVVTPGELLRRLESGAVLDGELPPTRLNLPSSTETARWIAEIMDGLRRRIRPGFGNLQQELAVLQRDTVADIKEVIATDPKAKPPSLGGRANELRLRNEEIASAWVIACVFVRQLEVRGLIERRLAGEGSEERERAVRAEGSSRTPRDYLMHVLAEAGRHPACESILGPGNQFLWDVRPSERGAAALLSFFRAGDEDTRKRWDKELENERLWGELCERLSEPLRSANAIIQTPAIVEDLLLDRTLEPAILELGAARVSVIDPACGSGTLLAGAFRRLFEKSPLPSLEGRALAALDQVHGVDISPAATMITRIRLLMAYRKETDCKHISAVPALPLHVATADSLRPPGEPSDELLDLTPLAPSDAVLARRYSVVVCAPPLLVTEDVARRDEYRTHYKSASGKFPLFVPFIERCFQLAEHDGFVGMLVGNSFMKRQFGKPLVEEVLSEVELTHVIDTSGAHIPGYGVPTVMLLGRNRPRRSEKVRVVVGKRAEPIAPMDPAKGHVWSPIVAHLDHPGYEDEYIAVRDMRREELARHPWSLRASDQMELMEVLAQDAVPLRELPASVRRGAVSGLDPAFTLTRRLAERLGLEPEVLRPLVRGESIRDFSFSTEEVALVPQAHDLPSSDDPRPRWWAWLQRFRPLLVKRPSFGSVAPTPWWAWLKPPMASGARMRIIGPTIARYNHFALASGDLVASSTVFAIEPGDSPSQDELYSWLAFLNSSTASFWMKQMASSIGSGSGKARLEEPAYSFSSVLERVPIPRAILERSALRDGLVSLARQLEGTARDLGAAAPEQVIARWDRTSRETLVDSLADAQLRERTLLRRMVCEQEDLDWLVYEAIGLASGERHIPKASASPEQRPFAWLTDEPPVGLDRRLTESWRRRRKAGREHRLLKLLEAAPCKRAFRGVLGDPDLDLEELQDEADIGGELAAFEHRGGLDYAQRTRLACERWLLDRMEEVFRAAPPRCVSVQELASRLGSMSGVTFVVSVLVQQRGDVPEAVVAERVDELLRSDAVPYLAALRHTEPGLEKRAQWEAAWAMLRRQDAGERVPSIPVPPTYDRADYREASTFHHRGKLDAPTERFIAYPGEGDAEPRYGWAGWTPVQQAEALVGLMEQRQNEGNATAQMIPLLAGILELVSWMPSWDGAAPAPGTEAGAFQLRVKNEASRLGLSLEALRAWRPASKPVSRRGRESQRS